MRRLQTRGRVRQLLLVMAVLAAGYSWAKVSPLCNQGRTLQDRIGQGRIGTTTSLENNEASKDAQEITTASSLKGSKAAASWEVSSFLDADTAGAPGGGEEVLGKSTEWNETLTRLEESGGGKRGEGVGVGMVIRMIQREMKKQREIILMQGLQLEESRRQLKVLRKMVGYKHHRDMREHEGSKDMRDVASVNGGPAKGGSNGILLRSKDTDGGKADDEKAEGEQWGAEYGNGHMGNAIQSSKCHLNRWQRRQGAPGDPTSNETSTDGRGPSSEAQGNERVQAQGNEERAHVQEKLVWQPQPDKYLLATCVYGRASNRLKCLRNYILAATLLNRTLIIPTDDIVSPSVTQRWNSAPESPFRFDLAFDVTHLNKCFQRPVSISLHQYLKEHKLPLLKVNRLLCWARKCGFVNGKTNLQPKDPKIVLPRAVESKLNTTLTMSQFVGFYRRVKERVLCLGDLFSAHSDFSDAPFGFSSGLSLGWAFPSEPFLNANGTFSAPSSAPLDPTAAAAAAVSTSASASASASGRVLLSTGSSAPLPAAPNPEEEEKEEEGVAHKSSSNEGYTTGILGRDGATGASERSGAAAAAAAAGGVNILQGGYVPCRALIWPQAMLLSAASGFVHEALGARYGAVHLRRDDLFRHCVVKHKCHYYSQRQAASCVLAKLRALNLDTLFLSSDTPDSDLSLFLSMLKDPPDMGGGIQVVRLGKMTKRMWAEGLNRARGNHHGLAEDPLVVATVEKLVSAMGAVFMGTPGSTFSQHIEDMRIALGTASCEDGDLCLDSGPPEKLPL